MRAPRRLRRDARSVAPRRATFRDRGERLELAPVRDLHVGLVRASASKPSSRVEHVDAVELEVDSGSPATARASCRAAELAATVSEVPMNGSRARASPEWAARGGRRPASNKGGQCGTGRVGAASTLRRVEHRVRSPGRAAESAPIAARFGAPVRRARKHRGVVAKPRGSRASPSSSSVTV